MVCCIPSDRATFQMGLVTNASTPSKYFYWQTTNMQIVDSIMGFLTNDLHEDWWLNEENIIKIIEAKAAAYLASLF